jgi:hypothetical protein
MNNTGRVLTLVVKIDQDEYPRWIMDAHFGDAKHGVKVLSISEGDLRKELIRCQDIMIGEECD